MNSPIIDTVFTRKMEFRECLSRLAINFPTPLKILVANGNLLDPTIAKLRDHTQIRKYNFLKNLALLPSKIHFY